MRMVSMAPAMAVAGLLGACSFSPCENIMLDRIDSPDGRKTVAAFSRECGATTGENVQVSIIAKGGTVPDDGGNVLIMDHTYLGAARPTWIDSGHLMLTIPEHSRVYLKNADKKDMRLVLLPMWMTGTDF